ncbi:protein chibby homolog 1-like [Anneissia japonica]|uniref:protein chibby homolog 1-like n=1 Tax=Anneissia japonica TaxID=1529436 RepID=UPI0014259D71|nr:protein chibby homolog 1-like [Anneissia japonica]
MPLFGPKFTPKKTPPRRSSSLNNLNKLESSIREEEYGLQYDVARLKLGGQELKFDKENGVWISDGGGGGGGVSQREFMKLRKQNQNLLEENNLLKLKMEVLLDMLAETTAEKHFLEKEIDDYGTGTTSSKRSSKR